MNDCKYQGSNIKVTIQNLKVEGENFKESFARRIRGFALRLIRFLDSMPRDRLLKVIAEQLMRSGTSIGANYFEARAASSRNDFINFFTHSLKSANESRFWFEILIDMGKCDMDEARVLLRETSEIANIFASSILTLKRRRTQSPIVGAL